MALELEQGQLRSRVRAGAGARTPRQRRLVRELLAALPCLPLDEPSADAAAEIHRVLEGQGGGIGMADSLIAGIVLTHGGMLLTRNRRPFARVLGLALGRLGPDDGA